MWPFYFCACAKYVCIHWRTLLSLLANFGFNAFNVCLLKVAAASNFLKLVGGPQSSNIGEATYSAKLRHTIALDIGRVIMTFVQLIIYAGMDPNASKTYEYSAPDFGIAVPSSARDNAPAKKELR